MMIAVVFFFVFISKIELIECKKRKFWYFNFKIWNSFQKLTIIIFFQGNDTTASVNSFVMLMLASYPEIQVIVIFFFEKNPIFSRRKVFNFFLFLKLGEDLSGDFWNLRRFRSWGLSNKTWRFTKNAILGTRYQGNNASISGWSCYFEEIVRWSWHWFVIFLFTLLFFSFYHRKLLQKFLFRKLTYQWF